MPAIRKIQELKKLKARNGRKSCCAANTWELYALAFKPDASEAVQLACRAQHIQRWKIPRQDYPMTRPGYHQWRTTLYGFHAEIAGKLMQQAGYAEIMIEQVSQIIGKRGSQDKPLKLRCWKMLPDWFFSNRT